MDKTGQELLKLMFRPGENVCVSHNKYGFHSIPFENAIGETCKMVSPNEKYEIEIISTDLLTLVALNPITGWREDANCTAFRNFLIEMDYGPLPEQLAYAETIGLPYSAVVFSGNKSLHFLISLDQDLPSESIWRTMAEWTLAIATAADQNTKNPSRQIRIPGAYREPDKKQRIVRFKGATPLKTFSEWLAKHPEAKPKVAERRAPSETVDLGKVKEWVKVRLDNVRAGKYTVGQKSGRNKEWYAMAYEYALAGVSEDDTIDILSEFFTPDRDFKEREWKTCIKSAFKGAYSRKE